MLSDKEIKKIAEPFIKWAGGWDNFENINPQNVIFEGDFIEFARAIEKVIMDKQNREDQPRVRR